ncbi:MAG: flagellar hook assembly protein FlgD [Alphaproteobacteria bacterium]|nr:flagellar hook assembly protein FlgD [Alphaproteobacteria bacterium]
MAVDALGSSTSTGTSQSAMATASISQTYDQFIKLLTAQLKFQNPLDPMKPEDFTRQLVEFASVEQSIATNKNIEKLLAQQASTQMSMAVSYIGLVVTSTGNSLPVQNGSGSFNYTLPLAAASSQIQIMDSSGNVVFSTAGQISKGNHAYTWDGKDSQGNQLPDGSYTISVTALDPTAKPIDGITTTTDGIVTGVESANGVIQLKIGDTTVPLDKVTTVGLG